MKSVSVYLDNDAYNYFESRERTLFFKRNHLNENTLEIIFT